MKLCCLYIPDACLQRRLQVDDITQSTPGVLLSPPRSQAPSSRVKVVAMTDAARVAGVEFGMSLAQAEMACERLTCWDRSPEESEEVDRQVLAALWERFPAVEVAGDGVFYVGTRGLSFLYEGEGEIISAIEGCAAGLGFMGRGAIASNRFTAYTAARWAVASSEELGQKDARGRAPQTLIPKGQEGAFLGPLPITLLPAKEAVFDKLRPLNIHTLGAFAALSRPSIERRLGAEGVRLHRLASGEDSDHLNPARPPRHWTQRRDLDDPIGQAEGIIFLLSPLIESLFETLRSEGRACAALLLSLELEDKQNIPIPLEAGAPTESSRVILDLLRLRLAKTPLPGGVIAMEVEIRRATRPARGQQDLFQRSSSTTSIATTLERLRLALGEGAVLGAELQDAWLPGERFDYREATVEAFEKANRPQRKKKGGGSPKAAAKAGDKMNPTPLQPGGRPKEAIPLGGLRHFEAPRPLRVKGDSGGRPKSVAMGRATREVLYAYGPFCFSGGWWEGGHRRAYYRLLLENHSEVLIYHEHLEGGPQNGWYLEGVYD